jgi:hypothetical protein
MVFLFLLDVVSSIFCKCVFKIGSWVVYQSYNGVYYLYNSGNKQSIMKPQIWKIKKTKPIYHHMSL